MDKLKKAASLMSRVAEGLAALMLAIMFCSFLLTILFRYVLNRPSGSAAEVSSVMWLWLVLFGAGFVLREREEIRFDILYSAVSPAVRRLFMVIIASIVIGLFVLSLPAVWDYVTFMKVQRTAYLRIRFDWLFSVYVLFAGAVILRYSWLALRAICGDDPLPPVLPGKDD